MKEVKGVEIPYEALNAPTLTRLIEEYVSREGTDYGEEEFSLEAKVEKVRTQLKVQKAAIFYEEVSDTFDIVRR